MKKDTLLVRASWCTASLIVFSSFFFILARAAVKLESSDIIDPIHWLIGLLPPVFCYYVFIKFSDFNIFEIIYKKYLIIWIVYLIFVFIIYILVLGNAFEIYLFEFLSLSIFTSRIMILSLTAFFVFFIFYVVKEIDIYSLYMSFSSVVFFIFLSIAAKQ